MLKLFPECFFFFGILKVIEILNFLFRGNLMARNVTFYVSANSLKNKQSRKQS